MRYKLQETAESACQKVIGLGLRVGYRFNFGEHLYISPCVSLDYQFGTKDVTLSGKKFDQSSPSVFPAVHVGWRL